MLDFNHGALKPSDDAAGGPISDRINRLVDANMSRKNTQESEDNPRPYVGASAIGEPCTRMIQLEYIHNKHKNIAPPQPFEGKICRVFQAGHVFEAMVAQELQEIGFDIDIGWTDEHGKFHQNGWEDDDGESQGHYDGICRDGPILKEWPRLWECKALKHSAILDVMNKGLAESKPNYYGQIQINQLKSGMIEPCWFTMVDKDTAEWHHLLIGHDPIMARDLEAKQRYIIRETAAGRLIERPYSSPNVMKCRVFCSRWSKVCWKGLPD